jgi:DNA topoisomerase-2
MRNSADSDDDHNEAYIRPTEKTKPTIQASMTDLFGKKPAAASSKTMAATKPASKATAFARKASGSTSKAPPKKTAATKKMAQSSDNEISLDAPESAYVVARSAAPRRAAAGKAAYIELPDDDDDD